MTTCAHHTLEALACAACGRYARGCPACGRCGDCLAPPPNPAPESPPAMQTEAEVTPEEPEREPMSWIVLQ